MKWLETITKFLKTIWAWVITYTAFELGKDIGEQDLINKINEGRDNARELAKGRRNKKRKVWNVIDIDIRKSSNITTVQPEDDKSDA